MQAAPTYRWGLGFVVMRWRHLFWVLPLLGLLGGLGMRLWALYCPVAVGVIQPLPNSTRSFYPDPAEAALVWKYTDTLAETVDSLNLQERWQLPPDECVIKLRGMVRSEHRSGSPSVEVRVTGQDRRESIEIWEELLNRTAHHFYAQYSAAAQAEIESATVDVRDLKKELAQARMISSGGKGVDSPDQQEREERIDALQSKLDAAQEALVAARLRLLSGETNVLYLLVYPLEMPSMPPSPMDRDTLLSILRHGGWGAGIGIILSVLLAYLLELLFPRRPAGSEAEG
ncbi:hypothetical protein OKA04_06080 [Luteolibacter flavescens]|uniref:Lipopolysaccharide biosynthesis protein n=1 Tax=Luteolibacter flavescens TaxID=1859460 RepID=A0ABT3FL43_9BACT|nr:hypothetical protein [Luteolibacter flavescens]MCW1884292.1 hypothetical protein [Luteolibacter flavescens]